MKNAFGATLLFQIVIFFVVLFTGYICLSINQAKAFNVKNEIVKAIEKNAPDLTSHGSEFSKDIKESFESVGYRLTGNCSKELREIDGIDDAEVLGCDRDGKCNSGTTEGVAFCIAKISSPMPGGKVNAYYYKIETFYQLEIPIIKNIFSMRAKGETKLIYKKG